MREHQHRRRVRVGPHRISLQQGGENKQLHFYVDGKLAAFPRPGFDLGANHVSHSLPPAASWD